MSPLGHGGHGDLSRLRTYRTRQATTFDPGTRRKAVCIRPGTAETLAHVDGEGYVACIWMTFPGWFWTAWEPAQPRDPSILKTLVLRIYFDGAEEPAVAAPMGDFFGVGLCEVGNFASQYLGMSSGGFFCRFPMPFRRGFRIEVENRDEHIAPDVFLNAIYQLTDVPDESGYLHTQFHTGHRQGAETVLVADVHQRGQYVGCCLSAQGQQRQWLGYLESPEYMYIDDVDEPTLVGTGMEDYFMGGWYFREGPVIGPLHGVPLRDPFNASVAMYRVHDADAVCFDRSFRMEFVHPWDAQHVQPYAYSATTFFYLESAEGSGLPIPARDELLCWYRVPDRDHYHLT